MYCWPLLIHFWKFSSCKTDSVPPQWISLNILALLCIKNLPFINFKIEKPRTYFILMFVSRLMRPTWYQCVMQTCHCDKIEEGLRKTLLANTSLTNENPDFPQYLSEIWHVVFVGPWIESWMSFRFRPRQMIVKVSYYFKVDPNRP